MTEPKKAGPLAPLDDRGRGVRDRLAERLEGRGLEIGALDRPTRLDPARARAAYVDCLDEERLRENYPEKDDERFVKPDHVIPSGTLEGIPDASQDFLISSHVLEHVEDPIGALEEWHRVLKAGGLLYLAVPDMRFTPDRERPRTPLDHVVRDHEDGGRASREDHIREFGRAHLQLRTEEELKGFVKRVDEIDYKIHFHAWLPDDLIEVLRFTETELGLRWDVEEVVEVENEVILLLRKGDNGAIP